MKHYTILSVLLLSVVASIFAIAPSSAQMVLPKSDSTQPASGLEVLLDEARKDGSTVIVVSPATKDADPAAAGSAMRADLFYQARARIESVLMSTPSLFGNIQGTLKAASPDDRWLWLFRALGTALLGVVIGWYATQPITRRATAYLEARLAMDPETTADKTYYLIARSLLALFQISLYFAVAMLVAILLDSGHEPSRRAIIEILAGFCLYQFLHHGVIWSLVAAELPKYRLVNLSDEEAVKLQRHLTVSIAVLIAFIACVRFLNTTGAEQFADGMTGVLTPNNAQLLQLASALLVSVSIVALLVRDWKLWQHIFAPRDLSAPFFSQRTTLARLVPLLVLINSLIAMGLFVVRLALDKPSPGEIILAPFIIFYLATVAYGLSLIIIQALYNRRIRRFEALAAVERQRREQELARVDQEAGEEMNVGPSSVSTDIFEYQPRFRSLFEQAALAVIVTVSLGQIARHLGVPVDAEGNVWSSALEVFLAGALGWIAYNAVRIFVDNRMAEEGGAPAEAEIGGDGGGAGASRTATLLPILRYVLTTLIITITGMMVLSRMGLDVAPLFAGAGVIGIAVGFGAQTLIRDIFQGLSS